jgi:hypothetical protein
MVSTQQNGIELNAAQDMIRNQALKILEASHYQLVSLPISDAPPL